MMQNTSIIYHSESIVELQIVGIIIMHLAKEYTSHYTNYRIVIVMLCAHIFSYVTQLYRDWEQETYGKLDINGVLRAKKEFILSVIEIFS